MNIHSKVRPSFSFHAMLIIYIGTVVFPFMLWVWIKQMSTFHILFTWLAWSWKSTISPSVCQNWIQRMKSDMPFSSWSIPKEDRWTIGKDPGNQPLQHTSISWSIIYIVADTYVAIGCFYILGIVLLSWDLCIMRGTGRHGHQWLE